MESETNGGTELLRIPSVGHARSVDRRTQPIGGLDRRFIRYFVLGGTRESRPLTRDICDRGRLESEAAAALVG